MAEKPVGTLAVCRGFLDNQEFRVNAFKLRKCTMMLASTYGCAARDGMTCRV
eukprot:m.1601 g.1601  ORF g.1601 m.1601 type:complete len:52 (-) comp1003_c0_seq1:714-869(-)